MTNFLQFAVIGLGAGACYALLAQGAVLIYRGSGVVNFAHGAFAMLAAYFTFVELRSDAEVNAFLFIPDSHFLGDLADRPGDRRRRRGVGLVAFLFQRLVLRRLRPRRRSFGSSAPWPRWRSCSRSW